MKRSQATGDIYTQVFAITKGQQFKTFTLYGGVLPCRLADFGTLRTGKCEQVGGKDNE